MENINNLDPSTLLSPLTCYAIEKTRQDSTSHPESSNKWGCLEGIWPSSKFLLETDSCNYLSGPRKKFCTKDRCDVKTGIRCWPRVSFPCLIYDTRHIRQFKCWLKLHDSRVYVKSRLRLNYDLPLCNELCPAKDPFLVNPCVSQIQPAIPYQVQSSFICKYCDSTLWGYSKSISSTVRKLTFECSKLRKKVNCNHYQTITYLSV